MRNRARCVLGMMVVVGCRGSEEAETTATDEVNVVEAVRWTDLVRATAAGGSVSKTSGCDGCADSGAESEQQIDSGSGYIELSVGPPNGTLAVGLSNRNPGTSASEI